jgi:hypothetical protein
MLSMVTKPSKPTPNQGHRLLVYILFAGILPSVSFSVLAAEDTVTTVKAAIKNRLAEGDSLVIALEALPDKYQIRGGEILGYFTASADSNFWCGPNKPNPYCWLSSSVICWNRCDFQIVLCSEEGATIETLDFEAVEPATYRVDVDDTNRPEPGVYVIRFLYDAEVVDEFKIHIQNPK